MARLYPAGYRFGDGNLNPLGAGKVYVYLNETPTAASIYSDPDLSVSLTNPITLDSGGQLSTNVFVADSTPYTVTVTDSSGGNPWSRDNVWGILKTGSSLIIDVEDYGAVGNGTTDDSLAIQTAINEAFNLGGGTIYLKERHRIDTKLTVTLDDSSKLLGGVRIVGGGSSVTGSTLEPDKKSTLIFQGASGGIFDLIGTWDMLIENVHLLNNSATADYVVKVNSAASPATTVENVVFDNCVFNAKEAVTDHLVIVQDSKNVSFKHCRFTNEAGNSDGTNLVRLGANAADSSALTSGIANLTTFRHCWFAGDTQLRNTWNTTFESCEWFQRRQTTIGVGARIITGGDATIRETALFNCKSTDGDDTGTFMDLSGSAGPGGLTIINSQFQNYAKFVITQQAGPFVSIGNKYGNGASGGIDITITDGTAPVVMKDDHVISQTNNHQPVSDGRTLPFLPFVTSLSLGSDHTLTGTTAETLVSQAGVEPRGGPIRVCYGIAVSSLKDEEYTAGVYQGGTLIPGTATTVTVNNGEVGFVSFDRVIDSPAWVAGGQTIALAIQQQASAGGDLATIQATDSSYTTFLQIEELD